MCNCIITIQIPDTGSAEHSLTKSEHNVEDSGAQVYIHWLGVPGGERVGKLRVSSLSSDTEFLLTASQSVTPINFLARGLLGDLRE